MAAEKTVSVCFSPYLYPLFRNDEAIVVVVDVLRATTAMVTGFENGAKAMVAVAGTDEALAYRSKGYLVAGERNGEVQQGFDFGNSPFSYKPEVVQGREIAISTTNGTQAIVAAKDSQKLFIGAFANISTLAKRILDEDLDLVILCAGWKNKFNLEDTLFAGALSQKLTESGYKINCDSALAAVHLWELAKNNLNAFLETSSHRNRLKHLQLESDISYCLTLDTCKSVPELKDGKLVCLA
jgi:2-phosphosulfolactate phosphatase